MTASFLINRSDPLVAPFRGDRGQLNDLLKSICTSYPRGCLECAAKSDGEKEFNKHERQQ
jgi:hypothetical protein